MKTAFTYVFLMAAILPFASGCALEEMSAPREGDVHMRFSLSVAGKAWTKSSIDVDEDKLSDINLYAYRDGRLEEEIYIGNMPHEAEMVLSGKYEYEIYALANTGRIRAPEDEQELVSMVYAAGDGNTFVVGRPLVFCPGDTCTSCQAGLQSEFQGGYRRARRSGGQVSEAQAESFGCHALF